MKIKSVEVNTRCVIINSNHPERLGKTGYIVLSNCRDLKTDFILDGSCNRIHLDDVDVIAEIPEQDGISAGKTDIPVNERVKVLSSDDTNVVGLVGYITHPFLDLMVPDVQYIAGIWIEGYSPYGSKYNLIHGDVVMRYPLEVQ